MTGGGRRGEKGGRRETLAGVDRPPFPSFFFTACDSATDEIRERKKKREKVPRPINSFYICPFLVLTRRGGKRTGSLR